MSQALEDFVVERWGEPRRARWGGTTQLIFADCPNCGKPDKFTVSPEKGLAHCYSCHWGKGTSVYHLLAEWEGLEVHEVKEIIQRKRWLGDLEPIPLVSRKEEEKEAEKEEGPPPLDWERDFFDPLKPKHLEGRAARKYLRTRLTDEEIAEFRIRYGHEDARGPWDVFHNRVCVPIIERGEVVYFVGRAISSKSKLRYRNPKKIWTRKSSSQVLFGLDTAANYDPVVVVEGVFDAIRTGPWAVALLGKTLSDVQGNLLHRRGVERVVALFDADVPEDERAKLDTQLKDFFRKVYWVPPEVLGAKDPGSLERDEILEAIDHAKRRTAFSVGGLRFKKPTVLRPPWEK